MKKIIWLSILIFTLILVPSVVLAQLDDIDTNTQVIAPDELNQDETVTTTITNTEADDLILDSAVPVDESATTGIEELSTDEIPVDLVLKTEIDNELEDPGVLPDSPLYFVKRWSETFREWVTFGDEKKAELQYRYAMRRVAEIQKLVEKGKDEKAQEQIAKYEEHLDKFTEKVNKMADKKQDKADELLNKFEQIQVRQQSVLADVYDQAPEAAKAGLLNAIDNSSKGMENAIEKLQTSEEIDSYMDRVQTRLDTEFQNKSEDVKNRLENRIKVNNGDSGNGNGNNNNSGNQSGSAGGNN